MVKLTTPYGIVIENAMTKMEKRCSLLSKLVGDTIMVGYGSVAALEAE